MEHGFRRVYISFSIQLRVTHSMADKQQVNWMDDSTIFPFIFVKTFTSLNTDALAKATLFNS